MSLNCKKKKEKKNPPPELLTHCDHSKGKMSFLKKFICLFLDADGGNETMGHECGSQPFFLWGRMWLTNVP